MGAGEAAAIAGSVVAFVVQLLVPLALAYWGRRVAARRGNTRAWRIASCLPLVALAASLLGIVGTILGLVRSFGAVASVEPASRATALADGISTAMIATAIGGVISIALYLVAITAFVYGTFARPPA